MKIILNFTKEISYLRKNAFENSSCFIFDGVNFEMLSDLKYIEIKQFSVKANWTG